MGRADYYKAGDHNAICDACGFKFKASQLRKRWDGFMVCRKDWHPRHPQDFVRGVKDPQAPAWTRPVPAPIFVGFNYTGFVSESLPISEALGLPLSNTDYDAIGVSETVAIVSTSSTTQAESVALAENTTTKIYRNGLPVDRFAINTRPL